MEQLAAFIIGFIVWAGGGNPANVSPNDISCISSGPVEAAPCSIEQDSPTGQELCGLYERYAAAGCGDAAAEGTMRPGDGGFSVR